MELSQEWGAESEVRMPYWVVVMDTKVKDPREPGEAEWPGCQVLTFNDTALKQQSWALIAAEPEAAALLNRIDGVISVTDAQDGSYVDARTGTTVRLFAGGTQFERTSS
jgi:hypothetical protein